MRLALVLAVLAPAALAQQVGGGLSRSVQIQTHVLELKDLAPDTIEPMLTTALSTDGRTALVSVSELTGGDSSPIWICDLQKNEVRPLSLQRDGKPWRF